MLFRSIALVIISPTVWPGPDSEGGLISGFLARRQHGVCRHAHHESTAHRARGEVPGPRRHLGNPDRRPAEERLDVLVPPDVAREQERVLDPVLLGGGGADAITFNPTDAVRSLQLVRLS